MPCAERGFRSRSKHVSMGKVKARKRKNFVIPKTMTQAYLSLTELPNWSLIPRDLYHS